MKTNDDVVRAEVLVTGATGFIGRWLLAALTKRGERVAALVRGAEGREGELKRFVDRIGGQASNLVLVEGDVEQGGLGLETELPNVRVIHHLAARFAFGLAREDARRTNVKGTENALTWAATRPRLERFVFVGGYRMTTVDLDSLDDAAIRSHYEGGAYEGSKFEAYAVFRRMTRERSIPWTAVHPAALIGDSKSGETLQTTGLGDTVKKLHEGKLPALVGSPRVFVPVVTVDYLADYLATVPSRRESAGKDLVVFDPATPPLPELLTIAARRMGVAMPTRTLPIGFVRALPKSLTRLEPESLRFLSEDQYDTREGEAHAAAVGLTHPPLQTAFERWVDFLVAPHSSGRFIGGTFAVGDADTADVVMLHGIPFDGDAMAPLAAALGTTTARLDLPGLGRSTPQASDDGAWLQSMLADRRGNVVLVGHSLGAGVATEFAARSAEKVRALVLISPAFMTAPAPGMMRFPSLVSLALGRMTVEEVERRFLAEGSDAGSQQAAVRARAALARKGGSRRYAQALARATKETRRRELRDALRVVAEHGVPILVVHAEKEPLVHETHGATVVTIAGAGHNPHLTHTKIVANAVRAFLESTSKAEKPRAPKTRPRSETRARTTS